MSASVITTNEIRIFLMDRKELNPLLRGVRWDDKDIDQAIMRCVDFYNETPPFVQTLSPTGFPYRYTLLIGVSGHLLRSASIQQASNELEYAADGVTVQDNNKAEIFAKIGGMLWEEFKDKVTNIKIAINVQQAYGSSSSELAYVAM